MKLERYASDITDQEWALLELHLPAAKVGGRPRTTNMREVVNGIFYLLKTGCQWRMLPKDFPHWKTVNDYFAKWRKNGTWQQLNDALREQVRSAAGRDKTPSAGSIDSQSVKTTQKGAFEAGMARNTSRDASDL
jgi:putative transposase